MDEVKGLLEKEMDERKEISASPIFYTAGYISLEFWGWSIVLAEDGTWSWEYTEHA